MNCPPTFVIQAYQPMLMNCPHILSTSISTYVNELPPTFAIQASQPSVNELPLHSLYKHINLLLMNYPLHSLYKHIILC